jgi:hypothetical protein
MATDAHGPDGAELGQRLDRRNLLKKAGVVGVGIWAAPVVTSITSPAFATGSGQPGGGTDSPCITLTGDTHVTVFVEGSACNQLELGIVGHGAACTDCVNGTGTQTESYDYGVISGGQTLTVYMADNGFGECCTFGYSCHARYDCASGGNHVAAVHTSPTQYDIYFIDAGCDCERAGRDQGPQAGPTNKNLHARFTLTPA